MHLVQEDDFEKAVKEETKQYARHQRDEGERQRIRLENKERRKRGEVSLRLPRNEPKRGRSWSDSPSISGEEEPARPSKSSRQMSPTYDNGDQNYEGRKSGNMTPSF